MKIVKIITVMLSLFLLTACSEGPFVSDEIVEEKYIETEEYYENGKLYTRNHYMIRTDKRLHRIERLNGFADAKDIIYFSYDSGDHLSFSNAGSTIIVKRVIEQ